MDGVRVDEYDAVAAANHTLYAMWSVTVTFDANGGVLSVAQRHMLDACVRHCAPLALGADQFEPVPLHVWPPGMQADATA